MIMLIRLVLGYINMDLIYSILQMKRFIDIYQNSPVKAKYEHKVVVSIDDNNLVPLPINIETVNAVFNQV